MLIDLEAARAVPGQGPAEGAANITRTTDGFRVSGDPTAGTEVYLYCDEGGVLVADKLDELLSRLGRDATPLALNPFGISSLLHSGLVPPPYSEFENVFALTMGDIANVVWDGETPSVSLDCDYPWFSHKSAETSVASEKRLLELVTRATDADLAATGDKGFLMLSSGKDSVAIALALAEAGHTDVPCVTYSSGGNDPEPEIAAVICRRLGLEHRVVELSPDPDYVAATLTSFFTESPTAGTDLAQIPYALATAGANSPGGMVIDGGGNDAYMGFPVTGKWSAKTRLRVRGNALIDLVQKHSAVDSPLNYLARSRMETVLSGRMIRFHESRTFMPNAVDTRRFWSRLSAATKTLGIFDLYAFSERYITPPASMKKHILASRAVGHEPSVPWCDHQLADYCFNLPEPDRFNRRIGVNKVLLRKMLLRYLDYDAAKIGKRYFAFDGARFIRENMDFVRAEINQCDLWDREGLGTVAAWLDAIEARPLLYHAILTVFMVSGWRNHSRFVASAAQAADVRR